ncbi:hypothetical protein CRUP_006087 [Coryphaenoides rupestris]|nr:hypothetical protein CRUP_006087 [Coryphaenoides rupestris]
MQIGAWEHPEGGAGRGAVLRHRGDRPAVPPEVARVRVGRRTFPRGVVGPRQHAVELRRAAGPGRTADFLFTGSVRFGEAWMGCAPRYKDFLRLYGEARRRGANPCVVDVTD